ncbi:hypothetical protein RF679_01900 [Undibacterium cyanobacteriorum]|uniref:Uncharacterized protein n=1 Tax=Undibacterium cyanobacteriorum TaxID=3073561 RepID=A0ABY9RIN8_9BURK|nr:hypothetical protein [Undibacterium sp. 20NA77.5]WMW81047.1 hypothetical protein RF679_01900 [Undibacterium sp. 20NA77.5]
MLDFSEMLPVGMVAHGGQVAQIMADLAKRQRGLGDWEAFHYERISDEAVELTGGIVSFVNGSKRWLEPHDCVTIPFTAVVQEMQKQGLLNSSPSVATAFTSGGEAVRSNMDTLTPTVHGRDILHLSLALPNDAAGRQRILKTFHLQADFFGAEVLACSLDLASRSDNSS